MVQFWSLSMNEFELDHTVSRYQSLLNPPSFCLLLPFSLVIKIWLNLQTDHKINAHCSKQHPFQCVFSIGYAVPPNIQREHLGASPSYVEVSLTWYSFAIYVMTEFVLALSLCIDCWYIARLYFVTIKAHLDKFVLLLQIDVTLFF